MPESEFKEGDIVCLKSGGPAMTILAINENWAKCVWWSPNKQEFGNGSFNPKTLRKDKDPYPR